MDKNIDEKTKNREEESLYAVTSVVYYALIVVTIAALSAWLIYKYNFSGGFSDNQQVWGAFGDYMAGILNPVISFCALIALFVTIVIQTKQLNLSRKELEYTRKELEKSADAAQRQIQHLEAEAKRSEIYKIIESINSGIKAGLSKQIFLYEGKPISLNEILFRDERDLIDEFQYYLNKHDRELYLIVIDVETDLSRLRSYIERYINVSGDSKQGEHIKMYYRYTYSRLVNFLNNFSLLEDKTVISFFNTQLPESKFKI